MNLRRSLALVLALACGASVFGSLSSAHAVVGERIVAVIGDRPILLSELRGRARPQLTLLAVQTGGDPTRIAANEPQLFRALLDQMIDERLIEQQADKAHLGVGVEEIDRAIETKAQALGISPRALFDSASRQGFSAQDYRDEVRRRLLEGKMVQLRVAGRVRVRETDVRAAYAHARAQAPVDLQVLAMRLPSTQAGITEKMALADLIVTQARNGEDFCKLVQHFSDDVWTRAQCGDAGPQPVSNIHPAARPLLSAMEEGDISKPVRIDDLALVVFRLRKRAFPPYEQVREHMLEQVTEQAIAGQHALWVKELRQGVDIDVRL